MSKASSPAVSEVGGLVKDEGGGRYHFLGGQRKANCHHELQSGVRRRGQIAGEMVKSRIRLTARPVL